jgi:hypothetical protein
MAKTTGPLFSNIAKGTIGKALSYKTHKSITHVISRPISPRRRSSAQRSARVDFAAAVAEWKSLTDEQKNVYNVLGKQQNNISGFCYFISNRMITPVSYAKFGAVKFGATYKFGGP